MSTKQLSNQFNILSISAGLLILSSCAYSSKQTVKYFDVARKSAPYDVIIVPGVPHDGNSWSPTMNIRVSWANYLFQEGLTKKSNMSSKENFNNMGIRTNLQASNIESRFNNYLPDNFRYLHFQNQSFCEKIANSWCKRTSFENIGANQW